MPPSGPRSSWWRIPITSADCSMAFSIARRRRATGVVGRAAHASHAARGEQHRDARRAAPRRPATAVAAADACERRAALARGVLLDLLDARGRRGSTSQERPGGARAGTGAPARLECRTLVGRARRPSSAAACSSNTPSRVRRVGDHLLVDAALAGRRDAAAPARGGGGRRPRSGRSPRAACTSGSTYGASSSTTRDVDRVAQGDRPPAGPRARRRRRRRPACRRRRRRRCSTSRTRSRSVCRARRSSWSSSPASSTRRAASVRTEVTAEERAAGVGSSDGSRFMNTESTRPWSGCTSASRRRRPRVSVCAAIRGPYPGPQAVEPAI